MSTPSLNTSADVSAEAETASHRLTSFRFAGTGGEYFRIWIVNIALTLLTLGIYSAWAKVRRNRYIYGNTYVENANFEYHAKPSKILIGRIFALILFLIWTGVNQFAPEIAEKVMLIDFGPAGWGVLEWTFAITGVIYIVGSIVAPYLIAMSMRFRLRNSSHRNVRFRFLGTYLGAFKAWVLWGLAALFTVFILYPVFAHRRMRYLVDNAKYGSENFRFLGKIGPLYPIYLITAFLFLLSAVPYGIFVFFVLRFLHAQSDETEVPAFDLSVLFGDVPEWLLTVGGFAIAILYLGIICLAIAYLQSRTVNYRWNHTMLKNTSFRGTMRAWALAWIFFSNVIAIVCSFGLLAAWAKMRSVRYRVQNVHMLLGDNLDEFVGRVRADESAFAEEAADIMGLDFGF